MTSYVYKLAETPCWRGLSEHPEDCPGGCHGTGTLVPGLQKRCPCLVVGEFWVPHILCYTCGHGEHGDSCENCQGRGWVLIPMVEQMGVLARAAYKLGFRVSGHWSFATQLYYTILSVESDHLWFGEGDMPEESLAHAICKSQWG